MILITIISDTVKGLWEKKGLVTKTLQSSDFILSDCQIRNAQAFFMSLPIGYIYTPLFNIAKRNFLTETLASFYMFTAFECFDETGILFGINTLNSSIVSINNFNTGKFKNGNIAILGTTGAGKTHTEQMIGRYMRLNDIPVIFILPYKGFEYYRGAKDLGGTIAKIAPGSKDCINIMEIRVMDESGDMTLFEGDDSTSCFLNKKIQQIITFIQLLLNEEVMTNIESTLLDNTLIELYGRYGITSDNDSIWENRELKTVKSMPIISDLYNDIKDVPNLERIATILLPFVSGSCSNLNGHTNVDLANRYLLLDVSEAGDTYLPAFMFLALDCAYDIIKENRMQNNCLIIDEEWKLLINPKSAKYVMDMVKIVRGYGGATIIGTQEINDLMALGDGKYGKSIMSNSKIKILLQMEDEEADAVASILKLTASEKKRLTMFERGQCLLIANKDKIPVIIRTSEYENKLFATDAGKLRAIMQNKGDTL
jgi:type IV secretory pathway VirB4 component